MKQINEGINFSNFLDNKKIKYGMYDCLINAFTLWLDNQCLPTNHLINYNWDIYFHKGYDLFGGNIPRLEIINFLNKNLGLKVIEVDINKMPKNKLFLIALNNFDLPYLKDFYKKSDQIHYVLAYNDGYKVSIADSFYNKTINLSVDDCIQSWKRYKRPLIELGFNKESLQNNKINYPYIYYTKYKEKYVTTYFELQDQINQFKSSTDYYREDIKFKRYLGSMKTIYTNRELYFKFNKDEKYSSLILFGWEEVIRKFASLMIGIETKKVNEALEFVLLKESEYIEQLV
ncbi:hypothetical protein [Bacillus infantis]|uniref:hypothetical protein n=1 Tax=Bacillus infantis TaxID=324767 RepID=UPI00209F2D6E|nr:hypothetical protein [Bacillus infantis]MCP1161323.1 hypothetical protein [Bacillus infantis]